MTELVVPMSAISHTEPDENSEHMQVIVHIQAQVLGPKVARRRANIWLAMNAGHLLMAENPELVLGESLQWRFDIVLSVPRQDKPGSVTRDAIGRILLDARSGEILNQASLVTELNAHAAALAAH